MSYLQSWLYEASITNLRPARGRAQWLRVARLFLLAAMLPGCAMLPEVEEEQALVHPQDVAFEGRDGPVSEARADRVIAKLEGPAGATDILDKHLAYAQSLDADSPLVLGNQVQLLQNGPDTYEAMFAAIRQARDHINLETFIFDDDAVGHRFADLLLERQAEGVQVNVIYDSVGAIATPPAFFHRMREGGIRAVEFNPVSPLNAETRFWRLNNRDHRKQLVIDGRIVFIGGINISDSYSSAPSRLDPEPDLEGGWRDTHVRIEGPVVAEFQKLFLDTWERQTGKLLSDREYFPPLKAEGGDIVRALGDSPTDDSSPMYLTLMSVIGHAERSIDLTIAYFGPDEQLLTALTDAAQRGVAVRLILPSRTDAWSVFHLGRSHYARLLKGGVEIYERRGAVQHAKTGVVDGVWSTVGSTNMDWRSFLHNDEINAMVLGRRFAAEMAQVFEQDLKDSDRIELEKWRQRSWLLRIKEQAARLGAYWL